MEKDFSQKPGSSRRRTKLPYFSRDALLSRGELILYWTLRRALSDQYLLTFKVRAADLICCNEQDWERGFGHMVAKHHLDFVLCDRASTAIVSVIELDDKSHALERRKRRDKFLNLAFRAARIPLIRFQASARYDAVEIRQTIEQRVLSSRSKALRRQSARK